ncbi:MAG TPA: hypothetical protein PLN18_01680 [Candidatus Colwellbacteria bacterium]|nr:hypothetical protein [Candidatus Colwellbacteria bacterium]HQA96055.1 hypothetical protein [Candidatus Colwellbacteria bacterium]
MEYFEQVWNLIKSAGPLFVSLAQVIGRILVLTLDFITNLIRNGLSRI